MFIKKEILSCEYAQNSEETPFFSRKNFLACIIGNTLEWYDFIIGGSSLQSVFGVSIGCKTSDSQVKE